MLHKKIGILGGGQLGKMLCEAASPLNLDISILDKDKTFPAGNCCPKFVEGDFTNYEDVIAFGKNKDLVTIEIESVNVDALDTLVEQGVVVHPNPSALRMIKDKGLQKDFYKQNNYPSSSYKLFESAESIRDAHRKGHISFPFVQKARKDGYDGRGVFLVKSLDDLPMLLDTPSVVEDLVSIDKEIGIIAARNEKGEITSFPAVEMVFDPSANLVQHLVCPATLSKKQEKKAKKLAESLIKDMNICGLLAVELFLTKSGSWLINEVAPRPHNSGHHTIDANYTSQFEQHLRAILNLPLGSTDLVQPAVMTNILGAEGYTGEAIYDGIESLLAMKGVHFHIYGKAITKPFRKMGHVTVTRRKLSKAKAISEKIDKTLKVIA